MLKYKSLNKLKAFTLIELLVVITIIGTLATLGAISLNSARTKAKETKKFNDLKNISYAMELFNMENGYYPSGYGNCGDDGVLTTGANFCSNYPIKKGDNIYMASLPGPSSEFQNFSYDPHYKVPCIQMSGFSTAYGSLYCQGGSCSWNPSFCK